MNSFQMRLNPENEWDRMIIQFLESIPRYYRSQEVKRILVDHIRGSAHGRVANPSYNPGACRGEDRDLGARLDSLFG
ncbi:MAG TPA: hypothetical protein EYP55_01390 [Anaerolineae bacterium]|nr:hypothetical protein [Anaerolineae bacterium]